MENFQEENSKEYGIPYYLNSKEQYSIWVDPKLMKNEFIQHESLLRKRQRENEAYVINGKQKVHKDPASIQPARIMEDHPELAIEREKLLTKCLDLLANENSKYGDMLGNSKTSVACRKDGMLKGIAGLFGRIVWYELLEQIARLGDMDNNFERDAIFPAQFIGDENVIKELIEAGRTPEQSRYLVMEKIGTFMMKSARHLIELKKKYFPIISAPVSIQLRKICSPPTSMTISSYELTYATVSLEISYAHMKKLLRLYRLHTDPAATLNDTIFLKRLFCVIQRYESLSGKSDGYQMAFPNIGFQYLRNQFYTKTECFASPLNCYNQRFCSVAKDTDQFFGSLGNFFTFNGITGKLSEDDEGLPLGGSFEANPPFVEAIMDQMADRIHEILSKYDTVAPFSFIVIVPAWEDCRGVIEMAASKFNRPYPGFTLRLLKQKHDYRPGMQHRAHFTHQKSKVDTFVFFLQNELGAARWPVTMRHCQELVELLEEYSGENLDATLFVR